MPTNKLEESAIYQSYKTTKKRRAVTAVDVHVDQREYLLVVKNPPVGAGEWWFVDRVEFDKDREERAAKMFPGEYRRAEQDAKTYFAAQRIRSIVLLPVQDVPQSANPLPPASKFLTMRYMRQESNAGKNFYFGGRFQQDIEPHGQYFTEYEGNPLPPGWESGLKHFRNPLVIEWNTNPDGGYDATSWKARLRDQYKAKGLSLSRKIKAAGYDAIITVKRLGAGWETAECVDLTVVR